MNHRRCSLKRNAVLVALALSAFVGSASAQQLKPESTGLDAKVFHFELNNETVLDALWKLARGPVPFGFGFEKVLKNKLSDLDLQDPRFTFQLENKSMREILDALCQLDSRYTWSVDGATVNFFPRTILNDRSYLLNRSFPRFELQNATDVQNGLLAIVRQLPPPSEQIAQAQVGGDDPYPLEPWNITLEKVTVRQVVNRLAAHGGPYGIWIFGGAKDFRSFGFFNTHPSPWLSKTFESRPKSPQN